MLHAATLRGKKNARTPPTSPTVANELSNLPDRSCPSAAAQQDPQTCISITIRTNFTGRIEFLRSLNKAVAMAS